MYQRKSFIKNRKSAASSNVDNYDYVLHNRGGYSLEALISLIDFLRLVELVEISLNFELSLS